MKILITILFTTAFVRFGSAQTLREFTQQNKMQKKYLLEQIAALHTYVGHVRKGYSIVTKGLNTVGNIKNGDFNLHRDFFGSLKMVNPAIKKYARVADIIALQVKIINQSKNLLKKSKSSGYLEQVCDNLVDQSLSHIDELYLLTTANLELTDDERIVRIDRIYSDMLDKASFLHSFDRSAVGLSAQRLRESVEIDIIKKLNGLQ